MERKRKLPARAAARVEQISKKRTVTPPEHRSLTPAPAPAVEEAAPPPPLPKSIQAGKPLPTVEEPQPDDLPAKEFQSVQESGVLAESLHRSRQRWISEGIFEKYWTKPTKRKGQVIEEKNNPAKDSMMKLGQVTITIEPHVLEATMFAVKDPKAPAPPPPAQFRPIIQYGPPNGTMPPPPIPTPATTPTPSSTPLPANVQPTAQTPSPAPALSQQTVPPQMTPPAASPIAKPAATPAFSPPPPQSQTQTPSQSAASPRGMEAVLGPSTVTPQQGSRPPPLQAPVPGRPTPLHQPIPASAAGSSMPRTGPSPSPVPGMPSRASVPSPGGTLATPRANGVNPSPPPGVNKIPGNHPPGTDPIIVTLAEKATEDPQLRDLMRRVAGGLAPKDELEKFQAIIDQITAESRRKGAVQGPSADRLLVDGRTVRYFAEEVRAILDIVFTTNPKQTSADLRPPAGSDPLVVALVKAAMDEIKVRDMVRRIAENRPQFNDATDLKGVLDRLRIRLYREQDRQQTQSPVVTPGSTLGAPKASPGTPNGLVQNASALNHGLQTAPNQQVSQPPPQQALRSKGPPPVAKPDISAIVFEFHGGTGDRYLFPKFSVLEPISTPQGQQVLASFLIVRKGSTTEYGGDPELDYYQPVTVRLQASAHRHLESLARVVAPLDEVRRYMDDVMTNMTRAEYVLLAMRLPKKEAKEDKESSTEKDANGTQNGHGSEPPPPRNTQPMPGLLWTAKAGAGISTPPLQQKAVKKILGEDEQYQSFIASVTPKEVEES